VPSPTFTPAVFSQPFLLALNNLSDFSDALYASGGSNPRFDYTLTLDGTGKLPFELDIDGHVIKYVPKKPSVPVKLVWPPVTNAPTKLVVLKFPISYSGPWSLLHLLQAADDENGSLFTFRTVQFAGSKHVPLTDGNGNPITIQVRIDSTVGNIFSQGYFSKLHCEGWAVH
jgi:type VI protein secretion system component VasK